MLQVEVSRTEIFDRPLNAGQFFAAVARDLLDLGRPELLSIIFGRRVSSKRRPGRPFRARVFNHGLQVSLNVQHRITTVKQYLKCYADRLVMPNRPPEAFGSRSKAG
jgi:hypothetical protein